MHFAIKDTNIRFLRAPAAALVMAVAVAGSVLLPAGVLAQEPAKRAQPAPAEKPAQPAAGPLQLPGAVAPKPEVARPDPDKGRVRLLAYYVEKGEQVASGITWRVFLERAEPDGSHKLVKEVSGAAPVVALEPGNYVVHAAWGLAGGVKRVAVAKGEQDVKMVLNAGALRVLGIIADRKVPRDRLLISIYVPEGRNPEAKLIARNVKPGEVVRLPKGTYRIVSTYLEESKPGAQEEDPKERATNSVVNADVRVEPGKLVETTLKHRAARLTFKLVNAAGAEAIANTNFTVLTPGGDVIREMIGAFPSMILAEGGYVAIARNNGRTFQRPFIVQSGINKDVEILTKK